MLENVIKLLAIMLLILIVGDLTIGVLDFVWNFLAECIFFEFDFSSECRKLVWSESMEGRGAGILESFINSLSQSK